MKKSTRLLSCLCALSLTMSLAAAASAAELPETSALPADGYEIVSEKTVNLPAPEGTIIEQTTTVYENGISTVNTFTATTLPSKTRAATSGETGASNINEVYDKNGVKAGYVYIYADFSWNSQTKVVNYKNVRVTAKSFENYWTKDTHWHPDTTSTKAMIYGRTIIMGAMPTGASATIACDYNGNLSHSSKTKGTCDYC